MWRASEQPLWAVPVDRDGGTDWILVFGIRSDRSPHEDKPLAQAVRLGEVHASGKWWKGKWRFVEANIRKIHVEHLSRVAGEWIVDRLNPRRVPGVVRTFPDRLEAWARL